MIELLLVANVLTKWLALLVLGAGAVGSLVLVVVVLYWCWRADDDRTTTGR